MLEMYGGGEIRLYIPPLRDGAVEWNGGGGVEKVCPPASRLAIEAAATSFSCTGINQRYEFIHYCIDQITIKTPNPKCRLYWGLLGFIDWRYTVSHVGIFDPSSKLARSTFFPVPPPPSLCE
jgi:hypothetical protein